MCENFATTKIRFIHILLLCLMLNLARVGITNGLRTQLIGCYHILHWYFPVNKEVGTRCLPFKSNTTASWNFTMELFAWNSIALLINYFQVPSRSTFVSSLGSSIGSEYPEYRSPVQTPSFLDCKSKASISLIFLLSEKHTHEYV